MITQQQQHPTRLSSADPGEVNRKYEFAIQRAVDEITLQRQKQEAILALWAHALGLWKEWESTVFYGAEQPPSQMAIDQHAVLVVALITGANNLLNNFRQNEKLGDKDDVQRTCSIVSAFKKELEASYAAWHTMSEKTAREILAVAFDD